MKEELWEALSAFVDGEGFDPQVLAQALGEPGAREMLIECVLLRGACAGAERPSEAFYAVAAKSLAPRRGWPALRWLAAAAVLALAVLGLFDLGARLYPGRRADEPPTPTRVLQFEPGVEWRQVEGGK